MTPENPRDLLKADPKRRSAYGDFSLAHLTAYSVHWLNVWNIATTPENVSVLNARLFPADFALTGFPELPDSSRTNRSLLQMRPKYRGLATSDPRKGVYLTEKGRVEAARIIEKIGPPTFEGKEIPTNEASAETRRAPKGRERTFVPERVIEDRRSRLLYRRYKEQKLSEVDVVHLLGLLSLYDHTPPAEVRKEFKHLRDMATVLQDGDFLRFLDAIADKFRNYLDRSDSA